MDIKGNLNINSNILSGGTNLLDIFLTSNDGNTYTTGSTLVGESIYFDRTDALSAYTVDLSGIISADVTASNGLTKVGDDIQLGGAFTAPIVFSGAFQTIEVGTSASPVSNFKVESIEGSQRYVGGPQVLSVADNPGGRAVTLSVPSSTTSYQVNPAYFEAYFSGGTGVSTLQLSADYSLTTNDYSVTASDYTVASNNFDMSPTAALTTITDGTDLTTVAINPDGITETVSGASSVATFVTNDSLATREIVDATRDVKINADLDTIRIQNTNSSTDSDSSIVMVENQIQSTVSDTGTTQESYLQVRKNTVTLRHEDSGTTIQTLQMGDASTTLSSDDGTDTGYVTLFPTSAEMGVTNKVALSLDSTDVTFTDSRTTTKGIEYAADYSGDFTDRTLVDKAYVDAAAPASIEVTGIVAVTNVDTVSTGATNGIVWHYTVQDGSNLRAGTITAGFVGGTITMNEVTTGDIGSTTAVSIDVVVSGSDIALEVTPSSGSWKVKASRIII